MITGASSGVGRATAQAFARKGAAVGLIARGADALRATEKEVATLGGRALGIPTDVADAQALKAAAATIERELGPIDVWVNNAMASVFAPVSEITPEEFRRVTEVTYLGVVHGTLCALRGMRARQAGVIVQVGSALAYRGIPLQSAYCASKHAIQGFTESLRCELMHEPEAPVRVTMVQMPALNTPQFDVWCRTCLPRHPGRCLRSIQPEVAARAVVAAAQASGRGASGGSAPRRRSRLSVTRSPRALPTAILHTLATTPSRPRSPCPPGGRTTSTSRYRATAALMATSTRRHTAAARSGWRPVTGLRSADWDSRRWEAPSALIGGEDERRQRSAATGGV